MALALDIDDPWTDSGCVIVEIAGQLDAVNAPSLREEFSRITGRPLRLIVAMDGLEHLDETGLGVLLGAARRAKDSGGGIALVGAHGQVHRTLHTKALAAILVPCASIQDAIAALTAREAP